MMYENINNIDTLGLNVLEYAMLVELAYDEWLAERYGDSEAFVYDGHW